MNKQNIESKYQSLTDIEHVLAKPFKYIGSPVIKKSNVYCVEDLEQPLIQLKEIEFVPAILTLFNELINNSYDEYIEQLKINPKNPKLNKVEIVIYKSGRFIIKDNGGIPIKRHREPNKNFKYVNELLNGFVDKGYLKKKNVRTSLNIHYIIIDKDSIISELPNKDDVLKLRSVLRELSNGDILDGNIWSMFVPTMLFGQLKTSSNYKDKRGAKGGTNGVGASLVNIFSTEFKCFTSDGINDYIGEWNNNMSKLVNERVTRSKTKDHYTIIDATLDLKRFGINEFTDGMIDIFKLRGIEIASMGASRTAPLQVDITVHDDNVTETFKYNTFTQFINLFDGVETYYTQEGTRMHLEVGASTTDIFEGYALVNSIRTDTGEHMDYVAKKICQHLQTFLKKKHKIDCGLNFIKQKLSIVSRWRIDEPDFDTQTKENLISKVSTFGFDINIDDKLLKSLEKSEIILQIKEAHEIKMNLDNAKKMRQFKNKNKSKISNIEKLIDATGKNREDCILYIVEGDSAGAGFRKTSKGEIHGLMKLRGKFKQTVYMTANQLNEMSSKGVPKNAEVYAFTNALGLVIGEPVDFSKLRYHKIYIMTDADVDGYAIGCSVMGFLLKYFPELYDRNMVYRVQTPIVVCRRKGYEPLRYYSLEEFEEDKNELIKHGFECSYMKGLASLLDEDYNMIINNPVLEQIQITPKTWGYVREWFKTKKTDVKKMMVSGEPVEHLLNYEPLNKNQC